jgi:aminoglycoside 2'-N-acetyltransferase I
VSARHVAHTADVGAERLERFHRMLVAAFVDDPDRGFAEEDWNHCLGGVHAWVEAGDGAIEAHACVVSRRMLHEKRILRCGYVEGVAVRAEARGRGLGHELMREIERVIRDGYEFGALGATEAGIPLYRSRGWEAWRGPLSGLTLDGVVPTPDEQGGVHVLATSTPLDLDGDLTCDWREGDLW